MTNEIHDVSLRRYLADNERSTRPYQEADLRAPGYVVVLSLKTLGLADRTLRLRWSLFSGSPERPMLITLPSSPAATAQGEPGSRDFRDQVVASLRPQASDYRVLPKLWLPYPVGRSLEVFARVELLFGAKVLAFTDTGSFEVSGATNEPPAPAAPPPPPPPQATVTFFPDPPPPPSGPPPPPPPLRRPPPAIPAVIERPAP